MLLSCYICMKLIDDILNELSSPFFFQRKKKKKKKEKLRTTRTSKTLFSGK